MTCCVFPHGRGYCASCVYGEALEPTAVRRDSQLGGLSNRPDAEAQHWPAPDFERQAWIVSACNQLAAQPQHRRSSAYG